jgi:hypothetical protein
MEKAAAYVVSAGIVAFGAWILIAGLRSGAPVLWICVALIPVVIGLLSAFGDRYTLIVRWKSIVQPGADTERPRTRNESGADHREKKRSKCPG